MTSLLLIGDGRLATTLASWLPTKGVAVPQWSRKREAAGQCSVLADMAGAASAVLIAIKDDAILPWVAANQAALLGKTLVHFSGALVTPGIVGMHPLYAFPPEPVASDIMDTIPFVCDEDKTSFAEIFPGLPNPHYTLPAQSRPLYHALAVLTGNLATLTWNKAATVAWEDLGLPPKDLFLPYFASLQRNFEASPFDSLTGPVKRRDFETIGKNVEALENHPALQELYRAFARIGLTAD